MFDEGDRELAAAMLAVRWIANDCIDLGRRFADQQKIVLGTEGVDLAAEQRINQQTIAAVAWIPGALRFGQMT
jgi:hypothetical protein